MCITPPLLKSNSLPPICALMHAVTQQTLYAVRIADIAASHSRHCLLCRTAVIVCCVTWQILSAVSCVTQQTLSNSRHCLLCPRADIVCCITQQIAAAVLHSRYCQLCHTADTVMQQTLSAVRAADSVCCVAQQTFLPCHTADIVCCVTQQTSFGVPPTRHCLL